MIAIINYGAGNLFSVEKAFSALGADVRVSSTASDILSADKIVLPGVGAFGDCMDQLNASGLIPAIREGVGRGIPLLGICVGLQILFEGSEESSGVEGLGLLQGRVSRIAAPHEKIPHMGWNALNIAENHREKGLFAGIPQDSYAYFVHSYHALPKDRAIISSTCFYGEEITASISAGNIMATQFHPEKSGDIGLKIIHNFVHGEGST
ncbi:imidazole glycerol phosphate synthase subunit HisH [Selenomonas sp. oral taxon 138]|uniref:imidazole glycerol phosphate synthase subunit HisH n=1 Tax=Selenomonas sp. oral taxon 138 TaxID=712532 RepID=UPI0002A1F885|nr:imidazole glycerol phosphate synthase subunit HisH [Selenomonas sp. oral taxon 138]EKX98834.1 imidazole glycerol phosphate synthase, glutamine amidotransferase subunit [Selenomonas sp. oral taxon 138 str. F0429]